MLPGNKKNASNSSLAAIAQALYLLNISFLPVISFIILIILYRKNKTQAQPTVKLHMQQAILASVFAGILLLAVSSIILLIGSFESPYTWMTLLIYFICIHSALILYGVFAFIKALSMKDYIYPVFGKLWK